MLRLGLFNFRNDDVVLIAGDKATVAELGKRLQTEFRSGTSCVAIHDVASVSARHPVLLFAVQGRFRPPEKNSFVWTCSDSDVEKLTNAGTRATQLRFDLSRTPPYLCVDFSGHFDETWWTTYG